MKVATRGSAYLGYEEETHSSWPEPSLKEWCVEPHTLPSPHINYTHSVGCSNK